MQTGIGYLEALEIVLSRIGRTSAESVDLVTATGRVLAAGVAARVDSPSVNASLKDGYAVRAADVALATPGSPVMLTVVGTETAGNGSGVRLGPGQAVQVTTGAALPEGAGSVLSAEFTRREGSVLWAFRDADEGRNVLARGTDVALGREVARAGRLLDPALIGLLAAAGVDRVSVRSRPRVAVLATGDEVVAPGHELPPGKLYASNMTECLSWLKACGFPDPLGRVVPDREAALAAAVSSAVDQADALITSGGAWGSERDLVLRVLAGLGWEGLFYRVRLGPGKAAAFGFLNDKPVFVLPGGPPSFEAGLLLLALPGLYARAGLTGDLFPRVSAVLLEDVSGQVDWTQCRHARVRRSPEGFVAEPLAGRSRLSSMADKNALFLIPEGRDHLPAGTVIEAIMLSWLRLGGDPD